VNGDEIRTSVFKVATQIWRLVCTRNMKSDKWASSSASCVHFKHLTSTSRCPATESSYILSDFDLNPRKFVTYATSRLEFTAFLTLCRSPVTEAVLLLAEMPDDAGSDVTGGGVLRGYGHVPRGRHGGAQLCRPRRRGLLHHCRCGVHLLR